MSAQAQENTPILVTGQAIDALTHRGVKHLQIINLTNINRFYGDSSGYFLVQAGRNDSLVFIAKGYATAYLCYQDSPVQKVYNLQLILSKVSVELPEITVKTDRKFEEISSDAQKLGYDKKDYMVHGAQVLQSPFTYLYQLFSVQEKDKRAYAELMNDVRRKQLVEELVNNYLSLGVLRLEPDEVEDFVDFANVPEDFLKTMSEYEFILYLQQQSRLFHSRVLPPLRDR